MGGLNISSVHIVVFECKVPTSFVSIHVDVSGGRHFVIFFELEIV